MARRKLVRETRSPDQRMHVLVQVNQNKAAWHQCAWPFQLQPRCVIPKHMARPQATHTLSRATSSIGARLSGVWNRGTTSSSTTWCVHAEQRCGSRQRADDDMSEDVESRFKRMRWPRPMSVSMLCKGDDESGELTNAVSLCRVRM